MRQSVNINWEAIGAELANLTDEEQVAFFQGFTNELRHWPTHYAREMQCQYIRAKLTDEQRRYIATIGWDGKD